MTKYKWLHIQKKRAQVKGKYQKWFDLKRDVMIVVWSRFLYSVFSYKINLNSLGESLELRWLFTYSDPNILCCTLLDMESTLILYVSIVQRRWEVIIWNGIARISMIKSLDFFKTMKNQRIHFALTGKSTQWTQRMLNLS